MADAPGQVFAYNSGAPTILTAILRKATGKSASDFAAENLFGPLGITDFGWRTDRNGLEAGGAGIRLTPRDMAKLGYLYLREGFWEGKQIVPGKLGESLVREADGSQDGRRKTLRLRLSLVAAKLRRELGAGLRRAIHHPGARARSRGGVHCGPQSSGFPEALRPVRGLHSPGGKIRRAPQPNPASAARLEGLIKAVSNPEPQPVPPLPPVAQAISGKTFVADPNNPLEYGRCHFPSRADTAVMKSTFSVGRPGTITARIGWDIPHQSEYGRLRGGPRRVAG